MVRYYEAYRVSYLNEELEDITWRCTNAQEAASIFKSRINERCIDIIGIRKYAPNVQLIMAMDGKVIEFNEHVKMPKAISDLAGK